MKTKRLRKRLTDIVSSLVIIFKINRHLAVEKIMFEQM